ncbi:nitroreductase [Vicingaceae bacterium]|nr:nitroreductase [Vicingaceae bacterium]MDC1451210.1 nitroreductase [Vicingaceae bacterium]
MEYAEVEHLISNRQSLFTQQMEENASIQKDKLLQLLQLANYAPSHRRTEPWRFVIFRDEEKNVFFKKLAAIYKLNTSSEDFDEKKFQKIQNKAKNVAAVIAICMNRCLKESVPVFEEQWAVACSVQNMLLGMKTLGIIGYWSTPRMAFSDEMKSYLELQGDNQCMGFLQLGIPKEGLPDITRKENNPIEDKISWR